MVNATCSIVIPSRNCLSFLPTTLATITLQQVDGLEVIISDDGSDDGTAEWLSAYKPAGFRLTVLATGGVGAAQARDLAVATSTAPLIAFLDADDAWLPSKLAAQIAFHSARPDIGLTFTDYLHVTPNGLSRGTCFDYWRCGWTAASNGRYVELADAEARLLATNVVGTSTAMVRKDAIEMVSGFSADRDAIEDWDLWLRLAACKKVGFSSAVTTTYLMRPDSLTANRQRRINGMRDIVDRYRHRSDTTLQVALRAADARIELAEAEAAQELGNHTTALRGHFVAFCRNPDRRVGRAVLSNAMAATRQLAQGHVTNR